MTEKMKICVDIWYIILLDGLSQLELAETAPSEDKFHDSVYTELCVVCNMYSKICT